MSQRKIIGFVLLAVGIVLLLFGLNATQSAGEEIAEAVTGSYSDRTMLYLIVGVVGIVAGLLIAFSRRR